MQLLPGLVIEPSAPWAGWVTIEKVSSQVSGSLPDRATGPEPSSPTVALVASAVGAVPAWAWVITSWGGLDPASLLLKMALFVPVLLIARVT